MKAAGFLMRAALAGAALGTAIEGGAALESSALYNSCFTSGDSGGEPGGRVSAMSVAFQGLDDQLLASVVYRLRYGTRFGFSGDCMVMVDGGFLCNACSNDCATSSEHFQILWSGGDRLRLMNDLTGVLGVNPEGGRDYLVARGPDVAFDLRRGAPADCEW